MPTESRPGHVALIAGFYEDVSAVTKGWKENPVDFDSVFNQSRHTYSYGSPDILPMFSRGASDKDRVDAIMYGHEFEDFTKQSIELDQFVFDKVDALFDAAENDPELEATLRKEKTVFFLHLLGIDTAGHSYRPYSAEYYDNIKYIDAKIETLVKRVDEFYNDGKTAYVFTADHGMSDWGSHGDGHPDNTRTPLVAWGAGIAEPVKESLGDHDEYSQPWDLNSVRRNDVAQADIASLMSYLVGLNYPANSVGEIPLAFLDASDDVKAKAIYANAMTIVEQYLVKETQTSASQLHYSVFPAFAKKPIVDRSQEIINLIAAEKYQAAIDKSEDLMKEAIKGLRYLQTYNWLLLRSLVTMGYLGWIGYATTSFLHVFVVGEVAETGHPIVQAVSGSVLAVLASLLYKQESPVNYYLYAIFPVFFWDQIFASRKTVMRGAELLLQRTNSETPLWTALYHGLFCVFIMEAIVFGYFHREIFSFCFGVASMWPFLQNAKVASKNWILTAPWAILCFILATFTVLPANKVESLGQILAGGAIMAFTSLFVILYLSTQLHLPRNVQVIVGVQLGLIVLTSVVTGLSVKSLQAREGLPLGTQIVGWLALLGSITVPFAHYTTPISDFRFRLLIIYMAFAPTFIILTISYEGIFYISFFSLLVVWIELEYLFSRESTAITTTTTTTNTGKTTTGKNIYGENTSTATTATGTPSSVSRSSSSTTISSSSSSSSPTPATATTQQSQQTQTLSTTIQGGKLLNLNEVRLALFFFYLSQIGFFGIGNISSISSFSLDSVYRLIPIFDPFSMGALLIFKILAPFVVLSVMLGILNMRLGVPRSALFAIVLALSDILTLNFFYLVVDEGSWLDIGMGISNFSIASLLCLFMIVLEYLSGILTSGVEIVPAVAVAVPAVAVPAGC